MNTLWRYLLACSLCWGAAFAAEQVTDCRAVGKVEPICGLQGSEDLVSLPGGQALLISQSRVDVSHMPIMNWLPGGIALLDLKTRKPRVLYPSATASEGSRQWGDPACPGEIGALMAPHGLYLGRRSDGRQQLLVVNHGGRESVEFFEVSGRGRHVRLAWRGCVVAPEYSFLNDVAAFPGGGFLVTTMTRNDGPQAMFRDRPRAEAGENTGHVWRWQPGAGFDKLPGSDAPMPNGLQVDKAGRTLYLNISTTQGGGVRKIDIATGKTLGFAPLANPDNSSWAPDGQLLVAGITADADVAPCAKVGFQVPCGAKSRITAIDPATMTARGVFEHEGLPMGLFTGVVQVGRTLYIGSTSVDRILRVPVPDRHQP